MKYDPKVTGERIRTERQAKKLNRDEFIEAIRNQCGHAFSTNTLTLIENGESNKLSLDILEAMCEIFDCELGYLLGEEGYENRTRVKTDIVKETGISQEALDQILRLNEIKKTKPYLDLLNYILTNDNFLLLFKYFESYINTDSEKNYRNISLKARDVIRFKISDIMLKLLDDIDNDFYNKHPRELYSLYGLAEQLYKSKHFTYEQYIETIAQFDKGNYNYNPLSEKSILSLFVPENTEVSTHAE